MPSLAARALKRMSGLDPLPQPPIIRLRCPVVLMHGFGMLASLRRGGHLHEEAMHLRLHGVTAYAPNVAPYHTVSTRCRTWAEHLRFVMEESGAERVNLIAHSMGGLDARYLVSRMGFHRHVNVLATVATPHRGSSLASVVYAQPGRIRSGISALADWMGAAAMNDADTDFETALAELTPAHVTERFNAEVPDHPDVRYWSFAGRAGKGTNVPINPFLRLQNGLLFARDGVNDGFVSVESARWGEFLGTLDADHTQQVGLNFTPGGRFDANAFYVGLARRMQEAGF